MTSHFLLLVEGQPGLGKTAQALLAAQAANAYPLILGHLSFTVQTFVNRIRFRRSREPFHILVGALPRMRVPEDLNLSWAIVGRFSLLARPPGKRWRRFCCEILSKVWGRARRLGVRRSCPDADPGRYFLPGRSGTEAPEQIGTPVPCPIG